MIYRKEMSHGSANAGVLNNIFCKCRYKLPNTHMLERSNKNIFIYTYVHCNAFLQSEVIDHLKFTDAYSLTLT